MSTAIFRQLFNSLITTNNSKQISASRLRAVLEASADAIDTNFETVSLADGLGTYNATSGVATVKETGATVTLTSLSTFPNGKYFDVVVPGTKNITGESVDMEIGGIVISRGTKFDYIPKSTLALQNLNGIKVDNTGKTAGLFVPELQYRHSRGETEMFGNNIWGSPKGVIMYEIMSESVVFNRVRIPVYMVTPDQPAICRVYKASSYVKSPSLMTQLSEVTIPSGSFNSLNTGYQTVNLPAAVRLKAGEYCFIALWCDTASKMVFRRWDVDSGVAPLRHTFLYTSAADQWNVVWSETNVGSGFAQASFDLTLINNPADLETVKSRLSNDLGGLKAVLAEGNAMYGAYFPRYQYVHPRGVSEVEGNVAFNTLVPLADTQAVGIYEELTKPASFDRVVLPVFVNDGVAVTFKILYSKVYTLNTWMMTELASVSYAAGQFNGDRSKNQIIALSNRVHADAGFLYMMVHCDTAGKVGNKYWNTVGAAPSRKRFLRLTSGNPNVLTPWSASWGETTATFYTPTFILSDSMTEDNAALSGRVTLLEGSTANTVFKAADGKMEGVYLPTVQFQHPRGASEVSGNAGFGSGSTYYGFGLAQQMTAKIVFNKARIGLYTTGNTGSVYFRIYKGTAQDQAPSAMTLLGEVVMASKDANRLASGSQTILLPAPVTVNAGDYIHIYAGSDVTNNLQFRYWNVDAASPARARFKTRQTSDLWGSIWGTSSGAFYSTSMELSLVNEASDARLQALEVLTTKNPRLILPSKIYAVVGFELSLYYDALVFSKDAGLASPEDFSVSVTCVKGASKERYWRVEPAVGDIGTHSLTVQVFDTAGNRLVSKTVSLVIVAKANPATQKYIVDEGDSTVADTNSRIAMNENFALNTSGLAPLFLGSAGGSPTKSEAFGGSKFLGHISATMDITGGTRPNSLWNAAANGGAGGLDIQNYKSVVLAHSGAIDLVSIQLGINDMRTDFLSETAIQTVLAQSKTLVDLWLSLDANIKVIVQIPLIDMNTAWGADKNTYRANMWRLRELLLSTYDNAAYNARVFVGQAGLCVDRYYGYRITAPTAAARRYPELVITHTDNVHPRSEGYKEMGDAKFSQILALLQ